MKYIIMTKWMEGTISQDRPVLTPECCSIPLYKCEHITHQSSDGISAGNELMCRIECTPDDLINIANNGIGVLICNESDLNNPIDTNLAFELSTYGVSAWILDLVNAHTGSNSGLIDNMKSNINQSESPSFMSTKRGGVKPPLKYGLHELP